MKGRIIIKKNQLWFLVLYSQWNIWLSASFWLQVNTFLICSSILQTFIDDQLYPTSLAGIFLSSWEPPKSAYYHNILQYGWKKPFTVDNRLWDQRGALSLQNTGKPLKTLLSGWRDTCLSLSTEERVPEERNSIHKQTSERTVFLQERAGNRGGFGWMQTRQGMAVLGRAAEVDAFSLDFSGSWGLGRLCEFKEFRVYTTYPKSCRKSSQPKSSRWEEDWDHMTTRPVERLSGLG